MNRFLQFKSLWVLAVLTALWVHSFGCTYKPAYLQQGKRAQVSERWKVEKINGSLLSPDEKSVFETMGSPQFIRFYRKLSLEREKVYAWVYTDPPRFVTFLDGKRVDYVVLDDNLSSLNEYQQKILFWGGITAGTVAGLGLLYYYLANK